MPPVYIGNQSKGVNMGKLTDEDRALEKTALKERLQRALEQTVRGITDEEVADVVHEVCSENVIPI